MKNNANENQNTFATHQCVKPKIVYCSHSSSKTKVQAKMKARRNNDNVLFILHFFQHIKRRTQDKFDVTFKYIVELRALRHIMVVNI